MRSRTNTSQSKHKTNIPDGGWGWVVVFSSFMIHFIIDGITYSMGDIYLEPMLSNLHSNRAYVSAIFAFLESITLASAPISTVFTNRFGCRNITIWGSIVASFGFFLSRWWTNIQFFYLTIGLIAGIGCGLIYLPAIVSVGYYFEEKRSFAMGIAICGSGLGTVAFPFVMPRIMKHFFLNNYKNLLLLESFLILICLFFGLLMVPLPIEPSEQRRRKLRLLQQSKMNSNPPAKFTEHQNHQRNQRIHQIESLPFLPEFPSSVNGHELANDRRYTVVLCPTEGCPNPSDHRTNNITENQLNKSLSYRHSLVTMQRSSLYQGSLNRLSGNAKFTDETYMKDNRSQTMNIDKSFLMNSNGNEDLLVAEEEVEELKKSIWNSIYDQVNFHLLKDYSFMLFTISNFLSSLGYFVPYNFAHDLANDSGVRVDYQNLVIMAIGFSTIFGHLIIGYLADLKSVNRLTLYNLTLVVSGVSTILAPYSGSKIIPHLIYATFFGFFSGGYVGLTSIITVDLIGIDKLSNGMGIILLFQGIATAIGTPAAGAMREAFGNHPQAFRWPYFVFGMVLVLSGLILFAIPTCIKRDKHRNHSDDISSEMKVTSHS